MAKNVVSFILSFVILMKMWIFEFSHWVCSTQQSKLVRSPGYLVSNGRQVLLGGH